MNILEHIISSIKESQLDPNPFPHLFIDSFFEKKYYQELIEALPNKNKYVPLNKTGSVSENYPPERFIFDISPEILPELKEDQFNVFNNLVKAFFSIEFFNAITSKFKNTIDHRIANFSQEEKNMFGHNNFKFDGRISLVKDYSKYQLGAHTDTPQKFLTFLFYLPIDESLKEIGTSLYEPLLDASQLSSSLHYTKEETEKNFKEIKKVPFIPNSVLIFPRTNISFHGVSSVNIGSKERNLLLLNFYFKSCEKI